MAILSEVSSWLPGQSLREFSFRALARLDKLRGESESQAVTPDAALDGLRTMRDNLTGHLDRLAATGLTSDTPTAGQL